MPALLHLGADSSAIHNAILAALADGDTQSLNHIAHICTRNGRKLLAADLRHLRALIAAGIDHEEVATLYVSHYGGLQTALPIDLTERRAQ